eukprot:scaffold85919_cov42-Prasinocladus_malaysianus.AAC.1
MPFAPARLSSPSMMVADENTNTRRSCVDVRTTPVPYRYVPALEPLVEQRTYEYGSRYEYPYRK